ncbi:MAG: 4-hydroxy-tetrahydrodipicolinate reductase [Pseudomonadota bacterium]
MNKLNIAIMGAAGRMGQALTQATYENPHAQIAAATEMPGSLALGKDCGDICGLENLGVTITDDYLQLFTHVDAILDFTSPDATLNFAELSAQARIIHVIGTTGFTPDQEHQIEAASRHARIIKAGNMSLGVNLLTALTRKVAKALDSDFDIEIVEMHHKHKVDAPSGTALMLGEAAANGRDVALEETAVRVRDGQTGERKTGDIGFATLRGGSVIGEHSVIFAGDGERIELKHIAQDRTIFAKGAVKAALWARDKEPGLYDMCDVLGL